MAQRDRFPATDPRSKDPFGTADLDGDSPYYEEGEDEAEEVEETGPVSVGDHHANLAEFMGAQEKNMLGSDLVEAYNQDYESRSNAIEAIEKGLERLGLSEVELDDGPFDGASTCTVPMILIAMVQFWARALPELSPPDGPVKGMVSGMRTKSLMARAERVQDYMNHQCLVEDEAYHSETSRLIWLLPFYGCMYRETYWDPISDVLRGEVLTPFQCIPDASASTFAASGRNTIRKYISPSDIKRRQLAGEWCDIDLPDASEDPRTDVEQTINSNIDGNDPSPDSIERADDRLILRIYVDLDLEVSPHTDDEGEPTGIKLPYIVTIDAESETILAVYRNWNEADPLQIARKRITEYTYLPGFGINGLGLLKLIGSLQEAANGSLRAVLDGAATSSLGGGFIPKDVGGSEERLQISPGVYQRVDLSAEELAKAFYTPPFKEPSPQLTNALEFIVNLAQQFTATTEITTGGADNKAPVGTTIALIEQSNKVYSAIHRNLHVSQGHEFKIRYELNSIHLPQDGYPYDTDADEDGVVDDARVIAAADFAPGVAVVPVSDPNISSNVERIAMAQALVQLAEANPQLYNLYEAHRRLLTALKVPELDDVLKNPGTVERRDPISENQAVLTQQGIKAFPDQDHASHIAVHMSFMQNPAYGGHPEVGKIIMPLMQAHIAEHLAFMYAAQAAQLGIPAMPVQDEGSEKLPVDPMMEAQIAAMAAQRAQQLAQVPGLPPVQTGPDPEAEKIRREEEKHKQNMRHKDEDHAQKLKQTLEDATAKRGMETEKFISDQVNKQVGSDIEKAGKVLDQINESE